MEASKPSIARVRWIAQNDVLLFYGNGGVFQGEAVERWFATLEAARDMRLAAIGAGPEFSFDKDARVRGTALFKRLRLPCAVITEDPMQRMLATTARLVGMELAIYSWSESVRPFVKLGIQRAIADQLNDSLKRLRRDVDQELYMLGPP